MNAFSLVFSDFTFVAYLVLVLIGIYGFSLFYWWWETMNRRASEIYVYLMLFFASMIYNYALNAIGRYAFLNPYDQLEWPDIGMSIWWHLRTVPIFIIFGLMLIRMTQRAIRARRIYAEIDSLVEKMDCSHIVLNEIQKMRDIGFKLGKICGLGNVRKQMDQFDECYMKMEDMLSRCENEKKGA